jgi:hypothetical protein
MTEPRLAVLQRACPRPASNNAGKKGAPVGCEQQRRPGCEKRAQITRDDSSHFRDGRKVIECGRARSLAGDQFIPSLRRPQRGEAIKEREARE